MSTPIPLSGSHDIASGGVHGGDPVLDPRIARIEALHYKREGVMNDVCDACSAVAAWASGDIYAEYPWPCPTADALT